MPVEIPEDVKEAVKQIAMDSLEEIVHGDGLDPEEAVDIIAEGLDTAIDFHQIVPGPAGTLLEEIDDDVFRAIGAFFARLADTLRPDPNRIRARAARVKDRAKIARDKGHPKIAHRRLQRALRLIARADKVEARQA